MRAWDELAPRARRWLRSGQLAANLLEGRPERRHVLVALLRLLRERLEDDRLQRGGHGRVDLARTGRGLAELGQEELWDGLAGERQPARGDLVGHHAERVNVGAAVDLAVLALLRSHVLGRPDDHAGGGAGGALPVGELGDAEVDQLHEVPLVAALDEEDILGLEVAVDDPAVVGGPQRVGQLEQDLEPDRAVEAPFPEERRERRPIQELHHDVVPGGREQREVVRGYDVLVTDEVDGSRLVVETADQLRARAHRLVQELDRDLAADDGVLAEVDRAHTAPAEQPAHLEAPDHGADERIRWRRGRLVP